MERSIRAGILGLAISVLITAFVPANLYFLPSFIASLIAIYLTRLTSFRDGLLAALMTYFFTSAVNDTIVAAFYYSSNEVYTLTIDLSIVVFPAMNIVSALLAAYLGARLGQRAKPAPELPPPLKPLPPI